MTKSKIKMSKLTKAVDQRALASAFEETPKDDLYSTFGSKGDSPARIVCGHLLPILTKMRSDGVKMSTVRVAAIAEKHVRSQGNKEFRMSQSSFGTNWKAITGYTFTEWLKQTDSTDDLDVPVGGDTPPPPPPPAGGPEE